MILVVITLDGVFNRNINEIVSMLVLSICLYFSMVWIGNIRKFLTWDRANVTKAKETGGLIVDRREDVQRITGI